MSTPSLIFKLLVPVLRLLVSLPDVCLPSSTSTKTMDENWDRSGEDGEEVDVLRSLAIEFDYALKIQKSIISK